MFGLHRYTRSDHMLWMMFLGIYLWCITHLIQNSNSNIYIIYIHIKTIWNSVLFHLDGISELQKLKSWRKENGRIQTLERRPMVPDPILWKTGRGEVWPIRENHPERTGLLQAQAVLKFQGSSESKPMHLGIVFLQRDKKKLKMIAFH